MAVKLIITVKSLEISSKMEIADVIKMQFCQLKFMVRWSLIPWW